MKTFTVIEDPTIAYVVHLVNIGRRDVWCSSFLGRDGQLYQTQVANSEEAAITQAKERAKTHFQWPKGQKAFEIWPLGVRGR